MSEDWTFYPLLVDGEPASIFVDVGIASSAPVAGFDEMAYLRIRMREPRDDGLSSQAEYEALIALEDAVTGAVTAGRQAIYVGRNTSGGHRELYFYIKGSAFEQDVRAAMSDWSHYQYQTGCRVDPEWSTYRNFLYPSPEDFQRIGNRSVIDHLVEKGDDLEQPRTIDHFAFFNTEPDRDGFVHFLTESGFSIAQTTETSDGKLQVAFYRIDSPDDIDGITIDLHRAAEQNGGNYDAGGCRNQRGCSAPGLAENCQIVRRIAGEGQVTASMPADQPTPPGSRRASGATAARSGGTPGSAGSAARRRRSRG